MNFFQIQIASYIQGEFRHSILQMGSAELFYNITNQIEEHYLRAIHKTQASNTINQQENQ